MSKVPFFQALPSLLSGRVNILNPILQRPELNWPGRKRDWLQTKSWRARWKRRSQSCCFHAASQASQPDFEYMSRVNVSRRKEL
jgi:hypothetical protein